MIRPRFEGIFDATHDGKVGLGGDGTRGGLVPGATEAAGVIHGAIEQFATEMAADVARLMKLKAWRAAEVIVVGGGLRASRIGELAIVSNFGGLEHWKSIKTQHLFAKHVMPVFRNSKLGVAAD